MTKGQKSSNKPVKFDDYRDIPVSHVSSKNQHNKKNIACPFTTSCEFQYLSEMFVFRMKSSSPWSPVNSTAMYRKEKLKKKDILFRDYTVNEMHSIHVNFSSVCIDIFGFDKKRSFIMTVDFRLEESDKLFQSIFTIDVPSISRFSELRFKLPGTNYPDPIVRQICQKDFKMDHRNCEEEIEKCILLEELKICHVSQRYAIYGYRAMFDLFINIENSFELDLLKKCNINNSKIQKCGACTYKIDTFGHIPKDAATVCLTPMSAISMNLAGKELQKKQIKGPILNYLPRAVTMDVNRKYTQLIDDRERYYVEFLPNFFSTATAQKSLRRLQTHNYESFIVNFSAACLPYSSMKRFKEVVQKFSWLNAAIESNEAQAKAVKQIVNRTSFPAPYIIFGPPGTGKTSTLVEAVAQIVNVKPEARILVTVNSNSACDEIAIRLIKYVGCNKMYRFYAPSYSKKMDRVKQELQKISNLKYGYHVPPSVQELLSYNVIITTLVNSARLYSISPEHFDWIFADEAASVAEIFILVPIANAMKKNTKFQAQIVLLGDPKQLGAIMKTHHNERFGFGISMMERAMGLEMYQFHKHHGYNPNYIVQLTENFRSHVSILHYSNREFYNSALTAKQKQEVANFAIGWHMLPNPEVPIIFHAAWKPSEIDGTSLHNIHEINIIRSYVSHLLGSGINGKKVKANDIGIISPYAAQREKLKEIYTNGIEIGTVEYYQGREKLIIIFSAVRSKTPTVGFLKNEKRLNVALTRAKSLLIVIGNPETLGKNLFWSRFITMCCEQNCTKGNVPSWVLRKGQSKDESDDDDEAIRFEDMMNGPSMEE